VIELSPDHSGDQRLPDERGTGQRPERNRSPAVRDQWFLPPVTLRDVNSLSRTLRLPASDVPLFLRIFEETLKEEAAALAARLALEPRPPRQTGRLRG